MYQTRTIDPTLQASVELLPSPWVDSPFFKRVLESKALTAKDREYAEEYNKHGYLIVEEPIVSDSEASGIIADLHKLWPTGSNRLQDAWAKSQRVKELATNERILSLLRMLYDREPIPFQTLNFLTGTEQRTHSDVIHFSSLPARFMCGVWTALEDVTIKQGPLHYYPGSHKLPEFDYYDLGIDEEAQYPSNPYEGDPNWGNPRTERKYRLYEEVVEQLMLEHAFEKKSLSLKRGQSLIWSSNIFHGGDPIIDAGSTRLSQVTHFHFDGVIPWTPMFSSAPTGDYHLPDLMNIRTGQPVERSFNFMPVDLIPVQRYENHPSYKIQLLSGAEGYRNRTQSSTYTQNMNQMAAELEHYRNEHNRMQNSLNAIEQSVLWKAMQPIQQLARKLRKSNPN